MRTTAIIIVSVIILILWLLPPYMEFRYYEIGYNLIYPFLIPITFIWSAYVTERLYKNIDARQNPKKSTK